MIAQGQCTVFKTNLLSGLENFAANTPYVYKIALYTSFAALDNTTTEYSAANEIVSSGYTAGGQVLTITQTPTGDISNNISYISFASVTWSNVSFSTAAALIYNSTTGASVCVLSFGSNKTAANTFTITFPADTASDAIIRFS